MVLLHQSPIYSMQLFAVSLYRTHNSDEHVRRKCLIRMKIALSNPMHVNG